MDWQIKKRLIGLTLLIFPCIAAANVSSVAAVDSTAAQRYGVFEEPLVAFDGASSAQRQVLDAAVSVYADVGEAGRMEALTRYMEQEPQSPWRASILLNMALVSKREGYFSSAIALLQQAREAAAGAHSREARAVSARITGELLDLHARFGHREAVAALLDEIDTSPSAASISELVTQARAALWQMNNTPEEALRCGIVALQEVLGAQAQGRQAAAMLETAKAGPEGTSLARLRELALSAGVGAQAIYRQPDQSIPVPSVVHWRVGHYAAILEKADDRYRVVDPAMGGEIWMSRAAVEAEASGHFLVPDKKRLSFSWQPLSAKAAAEIVGAGYTSQSQPNQTSDDDPTECDDECSDTTGMPRYRVHSMLVSLNIRDTPVAYSPPIGPRVAMTVTYSQREANQPANFSFFNLGKKWTFNWLTYVQDDPRAPGKRVMIYLPGGGSRDYGGYHSGTGAFSPEQRTGAQLVRLSATEYERRMPDGSRYVYAQSDGAGYYPRRLFLSRLVDPEGNAVELHYDAQLRLTAISDALGQTTTFAYADTRNPLLITGVTDPFGRNSTFVYDASGRLNAITDALGMSSSFQYDSGTFIKAMTTPYGTTQFAYGQSGTTRWINITDPKGQKERVEYRHGAPGIPFSDSPVPSGMNLFNSYINGRNTFYWDKEAMKRAPGNYTQARIRHWYHLKTNTSVTTGVLESVKKPLENRIWYNYPGQGWAGAEGTLDKPSIIGRVLPDGSTQLTHKSYNSFGKLTKMINPLGREIVMEYGDNRIDLVRIKRKAASGYDVLATFTYNDRHRPLTYTDARGNVTTFTYNEAAQLTSTINALGHKTRYHYNDRGYLSSVVDANGNTIASYTYDNIGRRISETDAAGYTLRYSYDNLDRRIRTTYPDGTHEDVIWDKLDVASREDRYGNVTHYTHDAVRNLLSTIDPSGHITEYGYFDNGMLESVTDGKGNTTQYQRDIQRRKIGTVFADGSVSSRTYDNSGRLIQRKNGLGAKTRYAYGHDNRLIALTDPNGNATRYGYDNYTAELIERNSPDTGLTRYRYDAEGNLVQRTDANGSVIRFTYDALNRLTHIAYADGKSVDNVYDAAPNGIGRLAKSVGPAGTMSYEYDARGLVVKRTHLSAEGMTQTLRYAYNDEGQVTAMTYPSGAVIEYEYDKGRLISIRMDGHVILDDIAYTAFGPIADWVWANGNESRRKYDENGWLSDYTIGNTQRALSYDAVGNISAVLDDDIAQHFTYDAEKRLIGATADGFDLGYSYDANSNRVTAVSSGASTSYSISQGSNRLAAVDSLTYQYDAAGNTLYDGEHTYTYDSGNRLVSVDDGKTVSYGYNTLGQRLFKKSVKAFRLSADLDNDGLVTEADIHVLQAYIHSEQSPPEADLNQDGKVDGRDTPCIANLIGESKIQGIEKVPQGNSANGVGAPHACRIGEWIEKVSDIRFVYDGPNLLGEYGSDGSVRQEIVWLGDIPVAVVQGGEIYAIHTDQLGTPRAISNSGGNVVWRWDSDPFGEAGADEDPDGDGAAFTFNLRFPGQYYDKESGNHYNYYRDYDPTTGRYTQSDPVGLDGGLNTYLYANASPLIWFDVDGHEPRGERGATGGSAGQNSNKPGKKCREFKPPRRNQVECQHHQTGKWSTHPRPDSMPYPGDGTTGQSYQCGDGCKVAATAGAICLAVACALAPEVCLPALGVGATAAAAAE